MQAESLLAWRVHSLADRTSGCGNEYGGRYSREIALLPSLWAVPSSSIPKTPTWRWCPKMISSKTRSTAPPNSRLTVCTFNSSYSMFDYVRSWASSYPSNIPWRRRRGGKTPLILHTAIWLWQIGSRIVQKRFIGRNQDIIFGRRCSIRIISKIR